MEKNETITIGVREETLEFKKYGGLYKACGFDDSPLNMRKFFEDLCKAVNENITDSISFNLKEGDSAVVTLAKGYEKGHISLYHLFAMASILLHTSTDFVHGIILSGSVSDETFRKFLGSPPKDSEG